jgi:MFS family permease
MAATNQRPRIRLTTRPPAENSRLTPADASTGSVAGMRRLLLLVSAIVLVDTMLYAALTPLLPGYTDDFGLSKTQAGVLVGLYAIGVLAFAFPAGVLAARLGAKPTALLGLVLVGAASVAFAFAGDVWSLSLARFGQGIGSALSWAGGLSWLISAAPRERRGELLGAALGAAIFGALLGPVLGGVASVVGSRAAFCAVGAAAALVAFGGSRVPGAPTERFTAAALGRAFGSPVFLAGIWLMLLPALLFGILNVLASLDLDRLGWGAVAIGAVFFTSAAVEAVVNPFVGRLADRRGALVPARAALPAAAVFALALAWAADPWLIAVLAVLTSIASAALFAPAFLLLADGAERVGLPQGLAFGIMNAGWATGAFVGPALGGALGEAAGDSVAYGLGAAACAVTFAAVLGRHAAGTRAARVPTTP